MFSKETTIGVCGAGAMGAGIAQIAAQAGHRIIVLDQNDDALARGRAAVSKGAGALLKRGKITDDEADALSARVFWTTDVEEMAPAGLVVEAIVEKPDAKAALYAALEKALGDGAAIATNTSSLSVTALAAGLQRPAQFFGLHFFNPAPVMKLVEVVSGAATDPALAEAARALMSDWGKEAVLAKDVPGFIVNRVARPFYGEGWRALEEGAADAATIDFLFRDLAGFRMGPFELGDFIGHDINSTAARSIYDAYFGRTRFAPSLMQGALAASGRLGRKNGAGVYNYGDDAPKPAPTFADAAAPLKAITTATTPMPLMEFVKADAETRADLEPDTAQADGALLRMSDGRTAGAVAAAEGAPVAVFDWMRDPGAASAFAFAASDETAADAARAFAAAAGKSPVRLADRPGLVVLRTLAQLANAAGDAVRDGVADADGVDRAMRYGVNYPFGPMAWAGAFGFARTVAVLDAIAGWTGDPSYRAGETLRTLALRG